VTDLPRKIDYTVVFMRMAATELRHVAETVPDIAVQLRYIADQLETEAADLRHVARRNEVGFV